jgi:cobalamin biosynthesis protein CobT
VQLPQPIVVVQLSRLADDRDTGIAEGSRDGAKSLGAIERGGRALLRQSKRGGAADSGARAGDEGDALGKAEHRHSLQEDRVHSSSGAHAGRWSSAWMKWVRGVAATVVLTMGVFVAALPPASIEARAHAAPFATDEPGPQVPGDPDIVPGDDDSDNADADDDDSDDLAQQQEEDEQWQEQQEQDEEQAQQQLQDSLQQMDHSEQEAEQQNEAAQQQMQLDEQLAQSDQQPGN